jgi:hypothetical protein
MNMEDHESRPTWWANPAFLFPPPWACVVNTLLPIWERLLPLNALAGIDDIILDIYLLNIFL